MHLSCHPGYVRGLKLFSCRQHLTEVGIGRLAKRSISSGLKRTSGNLICHAKTRPATATPRPKKSYGQNFLKDNGTATEIALGANLISGGKVLEIGPGTGVLTKELLKNNAQVLAIENDHNLMQGLQEQFETEIASGQMTLMQGDATRVDLQKILGDSEEKNKRFKVVANLPFNITTEVLKILLPMGDLISDVHVMLQVEAAQRLTVQNSGDSDYRAMSALVEFYSTPSLGMHISRANFQPQPHVDCQMVNFKLKREAERSEVPSEKAFKHLLNVAFSSRRKTLYNNLKAAFPASEVSQALSDLNLSSNIRPQELNASHFAALSRILATINS